MSRQADAFFRLLSLIGMITFLVIMLCNVLNITFLTICKIIFGLCLGFVVIRDICILHNYFT
jgi:hypothetical protein